MNELELSEICRRHGAGILRRCRAILRHGEDAEDAAQDVFMTLMEKGHQRRSDGELGGWIYRVTTHHCLNRLRSAKRRALRDEVQQDLSPTVGVDPYAHVAARTRVRQLLGMLDRLGQEIIIYRYLDGMTQEEIALATGRSRRTVGKRLRKIASLVEQVRA